MTLKRTIYTSIAIILGLLFLVLGVLIVLFFRSLIDAFISSQLPLKAGAQTFELWRKPPVTPYLKVYFFNVTNAEDFLENGAKLKLQEKGPYTYSETWEKIEPVWHPNGTLSYRQVKNYTFVPELSISQSDDDVFLLPNIPMLSAVGQMAHSTKIVKKAVATLLDILKLQPFTAHTVKEIMWGYDDPLIKLAKQVLPEGKRVPFDKFGLFVGKNATPSDVFTVLTGKENLNDFARITVYAGKNNLGVWKTDACNTIKGSDGTGFPAMLNENSTVYIYQPDFCRPLQLIVSNKEPQSHQGFDTLRFSPTPDTFGDVETYPENDCYCLGGPPCSPRGIFNVSVCQFGSPVFLSWPHFLNGDPALRNAVDGLNPKQELHGFYIDIQPKLGLAMQAKARMQINIQMNRVEEIPQTANLTNILIPVVWFEDGIDDLPPVVTSLIRQAIDLPEVAEKGLSYVLFILGGLLCLAAIVVIVRNSYTRKESMNSNGHSKSGEIEKSTNGVTNGQIKNHGYSNSVEMDDNIKHQNGKNKGATNGATESAMT
jgi:hypothetical protein